MSQRGGSRPGAGRKPGVPNKKTQEQQEEIAKSGLTPLEFLLQVMRDEEEERTIRMDAAYKAAPYVHPKLASVDMNANGSFTVTFGKDDQDL